MIGKEYQERAVDRDSLTLLYLTKELHLKNIRFSRKETIVINE